MKYIGEHLLDCPPNGEHVLEKVVSQSRTWFCRNGSAVEAYRRGDALAERFAEFINDRGRYNWRLKGGGAQVQIRHGRRQATADAATFDTAFAAALEKLNKRSGR